MLHRGPSLRCLSTGGMVPLNDGIALNLVFQKCVAHCDWSAESPRRPSAGLADSIGLDFAACWGEGTDLGRTSRLR